ncbi:MAG: HIT family protein [Bacteroidales bacterium]|jgi:histidine triad (HIT) family protein|nr:HIT family protein [Bacteroidales bacterium]
MASIFSRIALGEIPCHKVAESEKYLAFLDINPLCRGHVLVIPKLETDYLFSIEDEELAGLMVFAKKVAKAIDKAIPCKRVGVAVIGLEVPHAHIHLIPLNSLYDIDFKQPKLNPSAEELASTAASIRNAVE